MSLNEPCIREKYSLDVFNEAGQQMLKMLILKKIKAIPQIRCGEYFFLIFYSHSCFYSCFSQLINSVIQIKLHLEWMQNYHKDKYLEILK